MKFYLPNFEDMVDPEFDFLNDRPSPNRRDRWAHDWYAHQFYREPIFDGMLISKASIVPSTEERIRQAGGVHNFMRLDPSFPIMGDCGAFTYLMTEGPVYTVQQVLDYYDGLGFDFGVSLDHIMFVTTDLLDKALENGKVRKRWWQGRTTDQIQAERFELTLDNAREFLDLHSRQKPDFVPIGIAQGTSPDQYFTVSLTQLSAQLPLS